MKSTFFITIVLISFCLQAEAQWDQYFAKWDGKDGAVMLDMSWKDVAPASQLQFLLICETQIDDCDDSGFPRDSEYEVLELLTDSILQEVKSHGVGVLVGTFTQDCYRKDFFYVRDTMDISSGNHVAVLGNKLKEFNLGFVFDPKWNVYLNFLYPNEFHLHSMNNSRVVRQMLERGEELKKKRELVHLARFNSERDRDDYRIIVLEQGFRILETSYNERYAKSYLIKFERRDRLELDWINDVTLRLAERADQLKGSYEGWELIVNEK